jgi:hypothetical protein
MNITLRKANAIQNAIQQLIKSINLKTNIDISEFQNPDQEIRIAKENFYKLDSRRNDLLEAFYHIRSLVGQENAISGISLNLSKIAYIDKRIGQLEQITNSQVETDISVIKGKLEKLKVSEDRYGRDCISTSIIGREVIESTLGAISLLKKEKLAMSDKVLELNIKTEISLSDSHVELLKLEGIL